VQPILRYAAFALVLLAVAVGATSSATASRNQQATETRLAGPWYTPNELKALIAYSNASFEQKKVLLARTSR
jgi:hypothetical protein